MPLEKSNLESLIEIFFIESNDYIKLKYPLFPIEVFKVRLANIDNFINNNEYIDQSAGNATVNECVDYGTKNMGYYLGETEDCPSFFKLIK